MAARGKTMAVSIAGVGILVLLAGAVVLREPILEEWHIHKLRTGDREETRRAAEALGKMGSVRAVPALLEAPGRSRRKSPAAGGGVRVVSLVSLPEVVGGGYPALPFPAARGAEWQTTLCITVLGASDDPGGKVKYDARTRRLISSLPESAGLEEAIEALGWATATLHEIGDPALPALERAAADERLDPGARAFASFELARRALANPRIVLEGESAEVTIEQRTSVPLPGSKETVYLSAGDFEYRIVRVWVTPSTGGPRIKKHPLRTGEEVAFPLGGKRYILRLVGFQNRFIGTLEAMFSLREERSE